MSNSEGQLVGGLLVLAFWIAVIGLILFLLYVIAQIAVGAGVLCGLGVSTKNFALALRNNLGKRSLA